MLTDFIILMCPNYLGYMCVATCIVRYLVRFTYVPLRVSSHGSGCIAFVKIPLYTMVTMEPIKFPSYIYHP